MSSHFKNIPHGQPLQYGIDIPDTPWDCNGKEVIARTILFCCFHIRGVSHLFFKPEAHGITGPGAALSHGIDYIKTRPAFNPFFKEKAEIHRKERVPKAWLKTFKDIISKSNLEKKVGPTHLKHAKGGLGWMFEVLEHGGTQELQAAQNLRQRVAKELELNKTIVDKENGFMFRIGSEVRIPSPSGRTTQPLTLRQ